MDDAVVVAYVRTPIGRARKGSLRDWRPDDLAALVARAALGQVPELNPAGLDDLICGCALPGGEHGYNMGRILATLLGLIDVPATTVTRYCASSLQAIRMAFHAVAAGEGDAFLCVGVEAVSRYERGTSDGPPGTENPRFAAARRRTEARFASGGGERWAVPHGLADIYIPMGRTAENVASYCGVSRDDQDAFALLSQERAARARKDGFLAAETMAIPLSNNGILEADECLRPETTRDGLAALAPAFVPGGTVTAGNSCPLNDGAAALVVMSATRARALGIRPLGRIVASAVSGLHPEIMGLGPVESTRRVLDRVGMAIGDVELCEMNEAFAAQVLASCRALDLDVERVNVNGGAIALGHPFGMTGARLVGTLLHALADRDACIGLATLCVGGGQGMAMLVERL